MTREKRVIIVGIVETIRRIFNLQEYPIDVKKLAEKFKVKIVEDVSLDNVDGEYDETNGTFVIKLSPLLTEEDTKRFTTAHELGHGILHGSILKERDTVFSSTKYYQNRNDDSETEMEANCFAEELLMPENEFTKTLLEYSQKDENSAIEKTASYFGVSIGVAKQRGQNLGVVECKIL